MPASMAMRGLGRCANVPEPSPQTSPTARFHTAATAASLRAAPCAHMRAQLSASEPRLVPVHEPRGRTHAEERAARHLTLHAARWRCSGSACHGSRAPSRKSSRHSHEPLM